MGYTELLLSAACRDANVEALTHTHTGTHARAQLVSFTESHRAMSVVFGAVAVSQIACEIVREVSGLRE